MTKYQELNIGKESLVEYEELHTNFVGNRHIEEDTLDQALNDFFISESEKEL